MRIFIACGLTHVPRDEFSEYSALLHGLANHLTLMLHAEVKYALRDSDPQLATKPFSDRARLCYLWDRKMVEWADVVVAEASYPSTGLGIELQIAEAKGTPIVVAFRRQERHKATPVRYETPDGLMHDLQLGEGYVTLMALGMPTVVAVQPYETEQDARDRILQSLQILDMG